MHTTARTNTGAQVFLGMAYTLAMCLAVYPANSTQHTHTKQAQKHTPVQPGGTGTHKPIRTHANVTHSDLALDAKMSTGKRCVYVCVCVCVRLCARIYSMCVLTDDMLKTDTTHTLPVTAGFITRPRPL